MILDPLEDCLMSS